MVKLLENTICGEENKIQENISKRIGISLSQGSSGSS